MTINERLRAHDNDYSHVEQSWRHLSRGELVRDPFASLRHPLPAAKQRVSVVIPCWNSRQTIGPCLRSIELNTFNRKFPDRLEVIVVDDGSVDDTWSHLQTLRLNLEVTLVRQEHAGRAHAMNVGIALASGEIIISCDSDLVLTAGSIEELVKRQLELPNALLIGFRSDHHETDPSRAAALCHSVPRFFDDNRFNFDWPGWPDNMMAASGNLKRLGGGRSLWVTDNVTPADETWTLQRMVYGVLFSLPRATWREIGGYDERFVGWGWEDTAVGAMAIAAGNLIIPVPAAVGYHRAHDIRSPTQWEEGARNKLVFEALLECQPESRPDCLATATARVRGRAELRRLSATESEDAKHLEAAADFLSDGNRRGFYFFMLGQYEDAVRTFASEDDLSAESVAHYARSLSELGRTGGAEEVLEEAIRQGRKGPAIMVERLWAYGRAGEVAAARAFLDSLDGRTMGHPVLGYLLRHSPESHCVRGLRYLTQGIYGVAWRDFFAALMQAPDMKAARQGLHESLARLAEVENV